MLIILLVAVVHIGDLMMKGSTLSKVAVILMLFILVSSVPAALAQDDDDHDDDDDYEEYEDEHEPEYERDEDGVVWIQTDIMTAMLDPEVPSYQLWYTADDNGTLARFRVAYLMIVEFQDSNGDGRARAG